MTGPSVDFTLPRTESTSLSMSVNLPKLKCKEQREWGEKKGMEYSSTLSDGTLSPEGRGTRCGKGQKCAEEEQPVNPRESLEIPENAGISWNTCGNVALGTRARLEREI